MENYGSLFKPQANRVQFSVVLWSEGFAIKLSCLVGTLRAEESSLCGTTCAALNASNNTEYSGNVVACQSLFAVEPLPVSQIRKKIKAEQRR